jgi:excisionase family DNA binding protein
VTAPVDLTEWARTIVRSVVREEVRAALAEPRLRNGRGAGDDGYLSISSAAAYAAVAPGTLRRWIRTGRLPVRRAGRVYRIARNELEDFLAREGRSVEIARKASAIVQRAA